MSKTWPRGSISGILAVLAYITLVFVAYLRYPAAYSPLASALSQLGDPLLNPSGAVFYNVGGSLLGLLLIPFYLSLSGWNTGERGQAVLTAGSQTAGVISSLALVSSCVFPAGTHTPIHVASAGTAGITSLFFWIFSGFAMLKNPARAKWLPYFGYLPLAGIAVVALVLRQRFMVEWVAVLLFLVYIALLASSSRVMRDFAELHKERNR
jgi:hypothetical protein